MKELLESFALVNLTEKFEMKYMHCFFKQQKDDLREIDKYSENFYGHDAYDFTWQNSAEHIYIKGKVIIVNEVDAYYLLARSNVNEFPDFEKFIYSWEPYGESNM